MTDDHIAGVAERGYWQLRPDDAPLPQNSPAEAFLLAHARMLDQMNALTREGQFTVLASFRTAAGDRASAEVRAETLAELLATDPGVAAAGGCFDARAGQIVAAALITCPDGFWPAKALAEVVHARVRAAWRCGRGVTLREPRIDPPAPDAVAAWRAAHTLNA